MLGDLAKHRAERVRHGSVSGVGAKLVNGTLGLAFLPHVIWPYVHVLQKRPAGPCRNPAGAGETLR